MIKSQAALTYAEAQSRIDDERLHDTLSTNLRTMNRVAKILRKQRTERHAPCTGACLDYALFHSRAVSNTSFFIDYS